VREGRREQDHAEGDRYNQGDGDGASHVSSPYFSYDEGTRVKVAYRAVAIVMLNEVKHLAVGRCRSIAKSISIEPAL
jgi:hypothetical protein